MNLSTSSTSSPPTLILLSSCVLFLKVFIFGALIFRPIFLPFSSILVVFVWRSYVFCLKLVAVTARSSAKSSSSKLLASDHGIMVSLLSVARRIIQSMNEWWGIVVGIGGNLVSDHSLTLNQWTSLTLLRVTLHIESLCTEVIWGWQSFQGFYSVREVFTHGWSESTAFSKSMKLIKFEFWCSFISSKIIWSMNIWFSFSLPFRKPTCSRRSLLSKGSWIRCRIHLVKTFRTENP